MQPSIPGTKRPSPRQIAIFFDGTWNELADRTNVRRLYELTTARHDPRVLCFYDQGVGTGKLASSGSVLGQIIGGGMGQGFQKNIREALTFVTEHYQKGDEISVFGFSRGAYSAQVFATLVAGAGIPELPRDAGQTNKQRHELAAKAVKAYYNHIERAERAASNAADKSIGRITPSQNTPAWRGRPAEEAKVWRQSYWAKLTKTSEWTNSSGRVRPGIATMGLWDPVEGMSWKISGLWKTALSNTRKAEFERHRGHQQHPVALLPNINECYIAFSLDEQRQPFMAEIPDHERGQPKKYEFVWFPGDHSDTGGGHGDGKDIAGLSMNWMLSKVGNRLLGSHGSMVRMYANPVAVRHDLKLGSVRVRGEIHDSRSASAFVANHKENYTMSPVRSDGWQMKVHASVITRMNSPHDWIITPSNTDAIDLAAGSPDNTRNLPGPYIPRPFRPYKAGQEATEGWVKKDWTASQIRSRFPIVE